MRAGTNSFPVITEDVIFAPKELLHSVDNTEREPAVIVAVLAGRTLSRFTNKYKKKIQELHAKEVGVGNPSEERASS